MSGNGAAATKCLASFSFKDILSFFWKPRGDEPVRADGRARTVLSAQGQPPALSHTLTVDRVLGVMRSAEAGECMELFSIYRDILLGHAHTQTVYNQRKLAALTKVLTIVGSDESNPVDVAAAEACRALTRSPGWLSVAMNHLLNGHLYPLAVLEQVYGVNNTGRWPGVRFMPVAWVPVPYHLLDWTDGRLQIWDADPKQGFRLGTRCEPAFPQYVVHRGHLLTNLPDNWGGPLRAALFWYLFAVMDRDWWVRFLDRFGAPFIVGRYDPSNDADRTLLARAFAAATRLFGLVVSRETEIEVHSVSSNSHGEAFEAMQVFANGELSKLILGQTMTTTAAAGGIGGTQANVQESVRGDIEAWDITALAETVNTQIIEPFLRFNGIAGSAELKIATSTGSELESQAKFLSAAASIGLEPTDAGVDYLSKSSGIPLQRTSRAALALSAFAAPMARILAARGQPTDEQLDSIAAMAAGGLAEAFRGRYAPVRRLLETARNVHELEQGLSAFSADLAPGTAARLCEEALIAYAANGAASARIR